MASIPSFGSMTHEISTQQVTSFYNVKDSLVHQCVHSDSDQELTPGSMQAKSSLLPIIVNKIVLGHSHAHLTSICVCFHA